MMIPAVRVTVFLGQRHLLVQGPDVCEQGKTSFGARPWSSPV